MMEWAQWLLLGWMVFLAAIATFAAGSMCEERKRDGEKPEMFLHLVIVSPTWVSIVVAHLAGAFSHIL